MGVFVPIIYINNPHARQRDDQGPNSETIDTCRQLVGIVGTGLYHSMADVQSTVGSNCGSYFGNQLI